MEVQKAFKCAYVKYMNDLLLTQSQDLVLKGSNIDTSSRLDICNNHHKIYLFSIYRALDRNEYNHITATYFLLAERKLRMQRSDQNVAKQQGLGLQKGQVSSLALGGLGIAGPHQKAAGGGAASLAGAAGAKARTPTTPSGLSELEASQLSAVAASLMVSSMASPAASPTSAASPPLPPIQMSSSVPPPTYVYLSLFLPNQSHISQVL